MMRSCSTLCSCNLVDIPEYIRDKMSTRDIALVEIMVGTHNAGCEVHLSRAKNRLQGNHTRGYKKKLATVYTKNHYCIWVSSCKLRAVPVVVD